MDHFSYRCLRWILFSGLFFLSGGFLNATVHLVIFALVVRLFSARRERDYYFLAVIAFLMVLAASVLTVGSMFLLTFSGFMIVAVVAVILMEMRHAAAKSTVHASELQDELAHRYMAFSLAGHSLGEWPFRTAGPRRRSAADREVHPLSGPDGACRDQRFFSRSSRKGSGRDV